MAAAIASFFAFALGSVLPIVAISGPWIDYRELATVSSVVVALALTGFFGAKIGRAKPLRAVARNVAVSVLTMGIAYAIGTVLGVAVG
jgi:VIT1/CCC1 family predicted Fe2+/Mn2+ transporter